MRTHLNKHIKKFTAIQNGHPGHVDTPKMWYLFLTRVVLPVAVILISTGTLYLCKNGGHYFAGIHKACYVEIPAMKETLKRQDNKLDILLDINGVKKIEKNDKFDVYKIGDSTVVIK